MCIYNTIIKNKKYIKNKTNKGNIPTLPDKRVEYVPIGCGNCIECRKKYARDWQVRLLEEIKTNTNGKFITLTFSNESIKQIYESTITKTNKKTGQLEKIPISELRGYEKDNQIATKAIHLFRNRWIKEFKTAARHWLITELGHNGTENIHMHGIIWTNETYDTIRRIWKYGYIWPRPDTTVKTYVSSKTINYMIKYISKIDQRNKEYKGKVLASPGIGKEYIKSQNVRTNQFKNRETQETYITSTGHKIALPIYYRNKIYTEAEKEQLWLNKLDKEQRYVLGQKIDISKGDKEYNAAVKTARELNNELGYGGKPNENRKEYEEQRREIMIQTRIQKGTPSARSIQKGMD